MEHINWGRACLAIIAAAVAGSITDWFFFGFLWHSKYLVYPEVWKKYESGEGKQIAMASLAGLVSSAAFIFLCYGLYAESLHGVLKLAVAVWLVAAIPIIANEHIFMKLHPLLFVSHTLGYLARFTLAALAYCYIVL